MNILLNSREAINEEKVDKRIVVTFFSDGTPRSYFDDDAWDYHGTLECRVGETPIVSFLHIKPEFRVEIKEVVYLIVSKKILAVSTIKSIVKKLYSIVKILNSTNWKLLDDDFEFDKVKCYLVVNNYKKSYVSGIWSIIRELFRLGLINRYVLHDEGLFNLAGFLDVHQHIAIPEVMSKKIFSIAIDLIEKYHPFRREISAAYEEYFFRLSKWKGKYNNATNFSKWASKHIKHNVNIDEFVLDGRALVGRHIQMACFIVVLGFSGVRKSEAQSMNKESYDDSKKFQGEIVPLLRGKISKTELAGKPTAETWITHPITKKALELAYDLSDFARKHYRKKYSKLDDIEIRDRYLSELNSAFITVSINEQKNQIVSFNSEVFSRFAKKYNIVATESDVIEFDALNQTRVGQLKFGKFLPKLTPHDFRRTFACFLIRNKLGNLMTLRSQLKHENLKMTYWYQNGAQMASFLDVKFDSELLSLIVYANHEMMTDTLYYIYNEAETLSGKEGMRIIKNRLEFNEKYSGKIFTSRDAIRKMINHNNVSIVEHPTGYCTNPSCDRICANAKSGETCQHEIVTKEKALELVPFYNRLINRFRKLNDGTYFRINILEDIKTEILSIQSIFIVHNIIYAEHFNDEIKV